jgi:hypothetical protein
MAIGAPTRVTAAALAVSAFLVIAAAQAQVSSPVSAVKVTVFDQSGAVIADGEVVFKSDSKTIASRTGKDGVAIATLPSGRYSVTAKQPGFLKEEVNDFQVGASGPKELTMVLKVDPHSSAPCGPCGCGVCPDLVPTIPAAPDLPTEIRPKRSGDSNAPRGTRKIRSLRCLYVWRCSAS